MKEEPKRQKPPDIAAIQKRYPNAYKAWSDEEDEQLCEELAGGTKIIEISHRHKRPQSAIKSRIKQLENM